MISKVSKVAVLFVVVAALILLIIQGVAHRPITHRVANDDTTTVYYFAYGSNMPARYLSNIRFVDVFASSPGRLDDHAIKFLASGLDYLEPAFAHLVPERGASAFGVLHEIDLESLEKIICSEGSSYEMVQRPVEKVHSQQIVSAWTLVSRPSDKTAVPSKRYLELMIEGVGEYESLDEYQRRLAEMDGFYWPLVSEVVGTAIYAMILVKAMTAYQACSAKSSNG